MLTGQQDVSLGSAAEEILGAPPERRKDTQLSQTADCLGIGRKATPPDRLEAARHWHRSRQTQLPQRRVAPHGARDSEP